MSNGGVYPMELSLPNMSLVLLIGISGSGKSSFATKHFSPYEIVSSDRCRGIVSNDENNQAASADAFDLFYYTISKRLKNGLLTVADATNIHPESRKKLLALAKTFHVLPVAIIFDMPRELCEIRNRERADRTVPPHVLQRQMQEFKHSLKNIKKEGFKKLYTLRSEDEVQSANMIVREKLYNDKKELHGPFDIIGDVHGCYDELTTLLQKLHYTITAVEDDGKNYGLQIRHKENRTVIFLGDLVDRGPASAAVLKLVMSMVQSGQALCVPGNHEVRLYKKLSGRTVQVQHGLAETLEQLAYESEAFKHEVKEFLDRLVSHYVLDEGNLIVAHAGLKEDMHGRGSGAVRSFCLYGETTGETDSFGLPVRLNWAAEYRGKAKVVYGHTPVPAPQWVNNTIDIDTGCVFGGSLTALRYPENELVSVPATKVYYAPVKPLIACEIANESGAPAASQAEQDIAHGSLQQYYDDLLSIEDISGRRIIQTALVPTILIKEEHSIAALEAMSRFAVNPKWLIYLPPTMSPCETSSRDDFLEYPTEALSYYKQHGLTHIICEEKHMGSRAIFIICKDEKTAEQRFGIYNEGFGICYTRTGRNFFNDSAMEQLVLERVQHALNMSGFWQIHHTDWVCLDAEFMPWSVKTKSLIHDQYAATGTSGLQALSYAETVLRITQERGIVAASELYDRYKEKKHAIKQFIAAYRRYCWEIKSIADYKIAPFHILATEGAVHADKNHEWHMEQLKPVCSADTELFKITPYHIVNLEDESAVTSTVQWWLNLTEKGGEGMVVKPYQFTVRSIKGNLLQPAVKCRGKEYLRIIYGPDYCSPDNINRLKKRSLGRKRALALQEFALGIEALTRFIDKKPLRRIHECVFAILALESEAVDPRL